MSDSATSDPTLVIAGDRDFIPAKISVNIARALPNAKLVTVKNCGHFASLECGGEARKAIEDFYRR